ncbi:CcdB family protein [Shimia ponticola]|uniref:CcdB family protein n=1 Tax=Shimia ponticola TaxID=2582893 RepID=UPI0011BF6420|nr:CcdB family protein [Shimia ponticola]
MAQYDVYDLTGVGLVVDVQSDLLDPLTTAVVMPFMARDAAPTPARRLNPVIEFEGQERVLVPQFMAAVQRSALQGPVGTVAEHRDDITAALDMVFHGF